MPAIDRNVIDNLKDHRERLIYAFALLRGIYTKYSFDENLVEDIVDVQEIIEQVLNGAVIFNKEIPAITEVKEDE